MKNLNILFGAGLLGVVVCFIMTVYTGVQESRIRNTPVPLTIPVPAIPR